MNTCCNNIYPDEDLRRWEVGCSVPYYTKAEIDEKLENIDISGDCISSGDVQNMIDASVSPIEGSVEALSGTVGELSTDMENKAEKSEIPSLSGYATQQWVNDKGYLTSGYLKGIKETSGSHTVSLSKSSTRDENIVFGGDVDVKIEDRNSNKILMRCLLPIKGAFNRIEPIDSYPFESVNGLVATRYNYAIGQWNERDDDWEGSENYFSIGDGTSDSNRHNIFTILKDGSIKLSDGRFLQEWMDYIDNNYATQEWVNNQGYLTEHQPLKTINGQSLVGDGNITISGGGSADLSNYYNKQEVDDKLDLKANASDALSNVQVSQNGSGNYTWLNTTKNGTVGTTGYFGKINGTPMASRFPHEVKNMSLVDTSAITSSITSASTDAQVPSAKATYDALSNKADASNVYTKTEVNNIVNNKFVCITQAQYDALPTKQPDTLYLIYEV